MQLPAIVYVATYLLLARSGGNASFTQDVNVKKQKKIIVEYNADFETIPGVFCTLLHNVEACFAFLAGISRSINNSLYSFKSFHNRLSPCRSLFCLPLLWLVRIIGNPAWCSCVHTTSCGIRRSRPDLLDMMVQCTWFVEMASVLSWLFWMLLGEVLHNSGRKMH